MGVFDSIRDKLAEEDDETDAAETSADDGAAADGGADDAAGAGAGADESPDAADDLQSHANHWSAIAPPENREETVPELIETTVDEGEAIQGEPLDGDDVVAHLRQDGAMGTQTVAVDGEVVTAYPVLDGADATIEVEQVGGWDSGIEAWLVGESGPATLTAFATDYFALDREDLGGEYGAEVAVAFYNVSEAQQDTIEVEGEELDVSDFAGFRPWEAGAPDDAVVRTTVEEVERVELDDWGAYRIEAPLYRQEDDDGEVARIDASFYVADHVAGDYEPEPGDAIEGAAWIQARFQ